jgi:nucleoside-diphosphate-sugar epimerase
VVTGSAGLIGAETVRFFAAEGFDVVGIDNDMRRVLFGDDASHGRMRYADRGALASGMGGGRN